VTGASPPEKGTVESTKPGRWQRIASISSHRVLDMACVVALVALLLIAWSMVDPRPIPVIMAMSVAQVMGTISFGAFLVVVVRDLRRAQKNEPKISSP
jgi:hypothetical protein